MTAGTEPLTEHPAWKALKAHYDEIRNLHLRKLFADDPKRGEHMTAEAAGIYLDYSKNRITEQTLKLLLDLSEAIGLRGRIDAMFRGGEDQRLGTAGRPARGPACTERRIDPG
jgi:glucose-6-phosphate isomerase